MESSIQWDNEAKTIIRITYKGDWDWDVYDHTRARFSEMIAYSDKAVAMIVNFKDVTIPLDLMSRVREFKSSAAFTHPNVSRVVVIWPNPLALYLFELFTAMYPHAASRMMMAVSLDEAYELLASPAA